MDLGDMKKVNLFVVGAPKAGTTTLFQVLSSLNCISSPKIKEPNFFFTGDYNSYTIKKVKSLYQYHSLYQDKEYIYKIDASPSYLKCPESAYKIKKYNENAKIVIIIRDPIDRAISNWKMDLTEGFTRGDFKSLFLADLNSNSTRIQFDYFKSSCYSGGIERFYSFFKRENVLVLLFEHLQNSPNFFYDRISHFLGIEIDNSLFNTHVNAAKSPRNYFLHEIYKNKSIRSLLGPFLPLSIKNLTRKAVFQRSESPSLHVNFSREEMLPYFEEDTLAVERLLGVNLKGWRS